MTFDKSAMRSGESDILLVLDTNEYIFGLTGMHKPSAIPLDALAIRPGPVSENQHFLKDLKTTAYKVVSAEAMVAWIFEHLA